MKAEAVSRTAQYIAFFRAVETLQPKDKRLFEDSMAIHFLDLRFKIITYLTTLPLIGNGLVNIIQKRSRGALSSSIARTKYIDDLLKKAIDDGAKQIIILGSGFDTRALRLPFLKDIPVIEIDHPNTLSFKLKVLQKKINTLPPNVRYLKLDFNKQALSDFAIKQHIDFSIPTVILWEGLASYLSAKAVDKTFQFIQSFAPGSFTIFTYINKFALDNPRDFEGVEKLMEILNKSEEGWTFGFYPDKLPDYLKSYGLIAVEDKGVKELRDMYIPERKKMQRGFQFNRITFAKKV